MRLNALLFSFACCPPNKGFRHSPRHARRSARTRGSDETVSLVEVPESDQEHGVRKRKIKKSSRVQPEFYHSVQGTPTRRSVSTVNPNIFISYYYFISYLFSPLPSPLFFLLKYTLPWNLPKHERSKRKIQGGSVLDPAERAVLRIADERDKVQKKTFTKWINKHLIKVRKHVNDLYEDLRDGHNLISLLEALSGDTLPREKGRMRFHRLQNVQIALDYLKRRQVKLVNIRNDDITDGNPKLTLGLIWTIILHFQISDIHVTGESEDMSAKERLLLWSQQMTEGYTGIRCENFTSCWRDGRLFNAIIHKYRPDLIDMSQVTVQSNLSNLEHAFGVAEKLGVTRLLDPEDVNVPSPDEKSVITYVSSLYDVFPKIPEGGEGISANDVDVKWIEYQNMVNYLVQWIKHHVTVMSDRSFSNNPAELKALYNQYIQFKDTEIPPKERDKAKIKCLYKLMEVWIEFGRIKLPQGYHPNDVEKEWGKLIIAMLEREKLLRPEVERLEMLQQIATRVQHDSIACEDKLTLAHNSLQLDAKRLDSGLQFQNETEIAGYLLESENLIRQQIIDVQTLIDGKYYQADQLVQRVAKLRDDLMLLKSECSSVYSQGRSMSAEQTNSSLSLTPSLTRSFAPILPPSLPVSLSSGLKPVMMHGFISGFVPGVDPDTRQTIKLMQIRKPMMRSQLANQSLTEDEINMKFVQDLLSWVEEMQVQLDQAEWGSDMPSVESHLENHRNVHRAIEEFESSIKEAESAENQITSPLKNAYSEKLRMLESHYSKLLTTSRHRATHLESLRSFISRATKELIWLNEKEEEEVAYDWSDRNSSMLRKREYHSELMRELEDKDMLMRSVQDDADQLLLDHHPARLTIEAFKAAMQTQWSWVLQLCHCVEQHLRENAAYFEFYNDAKESLDYLKNLQETIKRKYSCDKTSSLVRLEDLLQDSMDEKEQLLQYRSNVAGLMSRAKAVVQLKPRNPDNPLRISIPIKAICDYKQIEITIYKEDECVLENNSHRAKWKVVSPTGNEAMVPSVCFTIPPPNKEAIERTSRIEQLYQNVLALWHQSHIDMKSIISWHLLMTEISTIRAWNASSIKTMLPGEHQQVLGNLQDHYDTFLEDSQESDAFTITDRTQLEREVNFCKQYYEDLLKSAEREEQEESACNLFISEVRNIRLRVENCEERLIRQIRTPLERDDLQESVQRISEQEKLKSELEELIVDLEKVTEKCDQFFGQTCSSSSPTLRTELNVVLQNLNQVYSLSSIHLDKLKTVNLIVKNTQGAEALVKLYETKLGEEEAVPPDTEAIEFLQNTLKQWRSEVDERREVFHTLEDELQKGKAISERMLRVHNERDMDVDWHKEKAVQLAERWENVRCQIDNRLHDLDSISMSLNSYRECYKELDLWIQEMEITQQKMQESQPEDIRALAEELNQQKTLASEVEMKQQKMDTCQKYSEQYSSTVKEYELHLMTYKAMVDSQQKSPVKRRRMQSSSDVIIQEFMDLRTRYTALVTLMTQYVKFASDALKRSEEEEELEEQKRELEKDLRLRKVTETETKLKEGPDTLNVVRHIASTLVVRKEHNHLQTDPLWEEEQATEAEALRQAVAEVSFSEAVGEGLIGPSVALEFLEEALGKGLTIAGVVDMETGVIFSVFDAIRKGLIDYDTGLCLLEAQVVVSGLIVPEINQCLSVEEALKYRLVDEKIFSLLRELSLAVERISDPLYLSGIAHPAVAAFEQRVISETSVVKILEIQLATGGLRAPATDERLDLEEAFQRDFIIAPLYFKLLERQRMCKELIDPNAAEKLSLMELMERTVVHKETGLLLLPVRRLEQDKILLKSGRKVSVFRALHEGVIEREVMIRLLGAQLFAGGIVDSSTGCQLTVDEALECGLIDQDTASCILSRQVQTGGVVNPVTGNRLTLDEAVQCNLITSSSALLVLEAQKVFMGLIWPESGEIFSVDASLQQGVVTSELAHKILYNRQKVAALYIPEDSSVLSLEEASRLGVIDDATAQILGTAFIPDLLPITEEPHSTQGDVPRWVTSCEIQICTTDSQNTHGPETVPPLQTETKQRFVSYLMMHSYMDAGTGKRLLLVDGDLDENIKMVIEANVDVSSDFLVQGESGFDNCLDWPRVVSIQESNEMDSYLETLDLGRKGGEFTEILFWFFISQQCLEHSEKLGAHLILIRDLELQLESLPPVDKDLEILWEQLDNLTVSDPFSGDLTRTVIEDFKDGLTEVKVQLDSTAFDIQDFISEHAADLSPQESRQLLKLLNSTQTAFRVVMEKSSAQSEALSLQLQMRLELDDQKAFEEQQQECNEQLQKMSNWLKQTENRIMGYAVGSVATDNLGHLQQYQAEGRALQKEIQANAATLANVIKVTERFLEESGVKLQPEQRAEIEKKLEEAKSKFSLLSEQTESNLKELEKAVTAAVKQETEKVAAVEQLEENKSKIEGLLGWLSDIGKEQLAEHNGKKALQQNGNEIPAGGLGKLENEDSMNGNMPHDQTETGRDEVDQPTTDGNLTQQYQKAKARHQKVLSRQQSYIISTQSVQDFLNKKGHNMLPAERERLERNLSELKVQYEAALTHSERRVRLIQTVQDELQKFSADHGEFENWLHQSESELGELQCPAPDLDTLSGKLQRQKSFSEDVISHKGDLRYITISGQRVLDAAKSCSRSDHGKETKDDVSAACLAVQSKLKVSSERFKSLHSKCNLLGKNLKDVVEQYSHYQDISSGLLPWLQTSEDAAEKNLTEPIAADPQNLQKQLEEAKTLQVQISGHQTAVEKLRKAVDALMATDGDLLLNRMEIHDNVDDVVQRYDNLSKSVNDRNERLQMTLTRSLSVQDGLDEMLDWMASVEKSLEDQQVVPLNSAAIQEALSKNAALEQSISSRQTSISAIKEKVNCFIETADPSTASALQAKMEQLTKRFTAASDRHRARTETLEKLGSKVELFETTCKKLEQFVAKKSQAVTEVDGMGKELTQYMQEMNAELLDQSRDLQVLNNLAEELGACGTAEDQAEVLEKVNVLSKNFKELKEGMLEEWSSKASEVEEVTRKGSELSNLINALSSPAKSRAEVKSELMAIQQDTTDVNHQYEEVGGSLRQMESQLQSTLTQIQQVREETETLEKWLDNMGKTAAAWDTLPTETEAIKEQVEQQKAFEAELKEKTGKMEQLKEKLTHLLQKTPDSPEAAKWKQMLDCINSKWKGVSQSAADRQQKLEESSSFLTQFQATEAQLNQWLLEKELMMNVLGPLSIDPNMLNTQKQQVQILLKEFDTRKTQHEQLKRAAEGILNRPGEMPPACSVVSDQLASVTRKWDNLTGQLVSRSDRIDQAIVKSTEYQGLVRDLSSKLSSLEGRLASQAPLSAQPEAVKQQLEVASEIRSELEREEKHMQQAQGLSEELSELVGEQYLKAELSRQLDNVLKPFRDLQERAGNRVHQLQFALVSSQQFQQMFDDFQAWLAGKCTEHGQMPPVSAKHDKLKALIEEQTEFQKSLVQQAGSYEMIIAEGESLLQNTQPGPEKTALQGQLATLKTNWEELSKQAEDRQEKLKHSSQKAQKYRECVENLLPWIEECEAKVSQIQVGSDARQIELSLENVKALQSDVDQHRRTLEAFNVAADGLVESSQADVEEVRGQKTSVNRKVERLSEHLRLGKERAQEMGKRVKDLQGSLQETKKQLNGARQQLVLHDALGPQALSSKHLSNMNAQRRTLQALRSQVDNVRSLARGLAAEVPDGSGTSELLQMTESLQQDYSSVTQQLQERCSFLEKKLQGISRFQNNIREMFSLFADLDDELDSMAPVGRDLQCLSSQKEGISEFILKLQGLMSDIERASVESKQMLESASSPDLLGLKRDLDALRKQCNKLLDRATVRQEQVESTLARVQEFCAKIKNLGELLTIAENHEEQQGCVGMETDVINQQVESFKVFQKEEIDPLQAKFQEVNWLGQGLIQSVAKNTNIQNLEHDLEESNTRWNTLTKKVAERAAQLQEALLHCGRFQDALESLLSWLMDTEELVTNQKPPSAEFKVVKAQIQEQKLLQHLLDDRKSTVEIIKREGEKIAELADAADKDKILKQINGLSRRWNALLTKADTRHRQLEGTLVVAQQFHDTVEPLNEWLTATEKKVANSEPIGTQTGKLQQQITQHKALEDDIISHNKQLHQAISVGQSLKTMSSRDDKDLVQEKLDTAQTRYIELQERCGRKAALIQQALSNARIFGEEEVELLNWLAEVHDKLNNVSVQDYDPDVLQKQLSEHLALHEDIVVRKQHVDQAVKNGLALLKQTTGDEVIIIQERLDEIKARYAEITTTSGKVLKTLEQALQLATKFKSAHEVLAAWLEQVEAELATYTSVVLVGEQRAQAHQRHKELKEEVMEHRLSLDTVNEVSSALLELVPWRAREGLDKLVSDDNERYRLASDTVGQKVEEIDAAIQRSQQFDQAADAEIAWIIKTEKKLKSFGDIRLEQDQTTGELQIQKAFSMDILRHKDTIDELVANGDTIMNSCSEEEKESLKGKLEVLQKQYEVISQMNSERYLQLERAQSLVSQFWETYEELWPWLQETLTFISQLPTPAIEFETLKQQQEELRQLRELIAEHKPHIDKMNKTGPQLLELSPREGLAIQSKYTAADKLYSQIKEDVKQRAVSLDEAISQSTQFHDKIDPMLESLERIVERLRQPPPVSAEVEKIKEQINENKNVSVELEKLQPAFETLKRRGEELIGRSDGADKDICAKAVQDQLDKMIFYWDDIKTRAEEREAKLLDVMDMAEKFWCDHSALIVTIKDSQDLIRELEEPGIDPSVVKEQQESLEAIKEEVDGLQEELEIVQNLGAELTVACGEPDKPIVRKNIDELSATWDNLNKAWKDRIDRLNEAMLDAVQFQDALQAMFDWIDIAETKLNKMSPVGTDLETVKLQIHELKHFKTEAYQQQIEMERLNHQGELLLKKVTEEEDKCVVQEPLHELKHFWENLDEKIVNRQHKLEGALLALGQFQHALDELLAWLTHTEELLNEQKAVGGDPKAIEIGIAKHHVLKNDVLAHTSTVEAVNKAGNDLIESNAGEEASSLRSKLDSLNQRWKSVLEQTVQRQQQLRKALIEAQGFHNEIEDMQHWLTETERHLTASKPVGGLPETAREQVNAHVELCAAFKTKEEIYTNLIDKGRLSCEEIADSSVEQDMNHLKERWESVEAKLNERKVKLEEALNLAMEFHNSLQDFINWLTQAEQTLTLASPPSLIMDTVLFQVDEHKVFANEVNSHREQIIELDKTGTHLKYFSQKQDVVLIKNLLISVQNRWEKVVQRSVDRGRALDDARKRAKQFQEAWKKLMEWLEDSERNLDSDLEIANDPDKVKMQLSHHKEFQKALGAKHSVYDTTIRTGRSLKEKSTLADDHQKLDDMLSELRDKWDTVCGKSVERQNKLEEALLFSGQFTDALQALIDWLYKIEPMLAEDQPVHGDLDLVMNLIDAHKVFQKELGKRTSSVQALKRSARELAESSRDDSSWVKVQMQELSTRWETVCALSVSKQVRLEQALNQSEEFRTAVHVLLEWLAEAEQALRFHGILPEDDEALRALIDQHKEFVRKLEENRMGLNVAVGMGEAILAICHPDSITTIKHWITIIRARFEEVTAWAKQHQLRLEAALAGVIANQELLENLLGWLQWAETILTKRDQEPIPQEIDEVKALIAEHQKFQQVETCRVLVRALTSQSWCGFPAGKRSPMQAMYSPTGQTIESKNPRANLLVSKWQQVWLLALDRRRKLNDALDRLEELREFANFDFDVWRKRYMRWMNHKKSRVMDFFRRIDKDQDGKITRQEFIDGILSSKFPTSRLEMSAVADIFDRDGDGYIDYYEFVAALHPNKDAYKPLTDADKIEDEVTRQVAKCKCAKRFQVEQIGDNKYRFGDSQQLRLVRILRSTVMVRVGGGWMALDEFLVKNDPCRGESGSIYGAWTLYCQIFPFILNVYPCFTQTPQHIIRNYDKPWLTNSKTSTPVKSPDSPECRVTPIQGSKLRPPGYLSGKSFHSGEESSAVSVPPSRGRSQATDARKASSRPASRAGSKTGSRASSRRGSDASDFDISDIQSVCSDASETVPDGATRSGSRAGSRASSGRASKIPTPSKRSPAPSKLSSSSKR
uniref:Dystonin n=1 Tax=Callorhinchus milii TaxID=7868 RepID=A0A4W3JBR7_CALMI